MLKGVAHYQFAGGEPPSFVKQNDLKSDIADEDARTMVGQTMTSFIDQLLKNGGSLSSSETDEFFAPFVKAMEYEGS